MSPVDSLQSPNWSEPMSAIRPEREPTFKIAEFTCVALILWAAIILAIANMDSVNGAQNSSSKETAAVLRGHEPIEIIGTLVAMTRSRWENIGYSFHVLLFKVDGVLSGKESGKFV